MLTLDPASACEVCAESFGPGHAPAVIPCGHVFCAQCLTTIVDKTSPRLTPACPLCRSTFSDKTWRLIRVDLGGSTSGSGWSGISSDSSQDHPAGVRADAKRLEDKVAQAATKKCSFEEVSALHKEVQEWLSHDPHSSQTDPQHASLRLSADLLRAILVNCLSYSEATKLAKSKELSLQAENDRLNAELRRHRELVAAKTQEIEKLRDELNKLRPNNATRPATRSIPTTPPRPGTSLGFSSTSNSSRSFSLASSAIPPVPSRPAVPRNASGHVSPPSTRNNSPPDSPAILPPAPILPFASLAPSPSPSHASLVSRAKTPGPTMYHQRSYSASVPQRPSTAMGSRTRHERWIPNPTDSSPLPTMTSRYTSAASRANAGTRLDVTFPVLEEDD